MPRWLKWTLIVIGGALAALAVLVAAYMAMNWSTVQILRGTQGVASAPSAVPTPRSNPPPAEAGEHDWTAWRGARNDGRSSVTGIRTDWSGGLTELWRVDYLCRGASSATWAAPVVRGNRLVVTGRDETRDLVFALEPDTGELLWQGAYEAPAGPSHGLGPRATPFIDGDRVYTFGRAGDLVCWDIDDGTVLWHANVVDEGGECPQWGFSSSPLVMEGKVFVQAGGTARTIAYDATSGEVVWKSGSGSAGYAAFMTVAGQLVVFHGTGVAGLDQGDGRIVWDLPWPTPYEVNATTPVVIGDRVFVSSGYRTGSQLLEVSADGAEVVWKSEAFAAQHTDPFVIGGQIYGYSGDSSQNRGSFKCLDLETGRERWSSDEIGWGTCTWVDGHLLCSDIEGNLALVEPDPDRLVKVAGLSRALGEVEGPVWTVPVVANGRLYLRFKQRLVCYDLVGASG